MNRLLRGRAILNCLFIGKRKVRYSIGTSSKIKSKEGKNYGRKERDGTRLCSPVSSKLIYR